MLEQTALRLVRMMVCLKELHHRYVINNRKALSSVKGSPAVGLDDGATKNKDKIRRTRKYY